MSNTYLISADVVERIVEILREHGDKLNEKVSYIHSFSLIDPPDALWNKTKHKFISNIIGYDIY